MSEQNGECKACGAEDVELFTSPWSNSPDVCEECVDEMHQAYVDQHEAKRRRQEEYEKRRRERRAREKNFERMVL